MTKYKAAAAIANETMHQIIAACVPGADVAALCQQGDGHIEQLLATVYNDNEDIEKGIALPTCITVNNVLGFHVESETGHLLQPGDVAQM